MLCTNPIDGPIGQIPDQDVVRVPDRRRDRLGVLEERWVPLIRVTAEEAIEVLEAHSAGPLIEWPRRSLHPFRNQVVLAEPGRVVAVVYQDVADCRGVLWNDRCVT